MNRFSIVKEVIHEWDPICLMSHAPDDEYDSEIEDIVEILAYVGSVDDLARGIHNVFVNWFGKNFVDAQNYTIEKCYPVALKIWNKIN